MTVKELIEALSKLEPSMDVLIASEYCYNRIEKIKVEIENNDVYLLGEGVDELWD